jgi:hypothetical protein
VKITKAKAPIASRRYVQCDASATHSRPCLYSGRIQYFIRTSGRQDVDQGRQVLWKEMVVAHFRHSSGEAEENHETLLSV